MTLWFQILCQFSVLAFGLLAGVFLTFSDFLMRSLATTGGTGGIEAMQVINREVFRSIFMVLFIGMAPVSLVLAGYGFLVLDGPGSVLIALSGVTYLLAGFGVTVVSNVPLNEALAPMDLGSESTRTFWTGTYVPDWTFWNTLRTVACLLAAALLLIGLSFSAVS